MIMNSSHGIVANYLGFKYTIIDGSKQSDF